MTKSKKKNDLMAASASYVPLEGDNSRVDMIAHCLDHFATECPYAGIPANIIFKTIYRIKRVPQKGSKEVKALSGGMSGADHKLKEKYGRLLITVQGVGWRASVDDNDAAEHKLTKDVKTMVRAEAKVEDDLKHIDQTKVTSAPIKGMVQRVARHLKENGEKIKGLLPPPPVEDDKK
jgi:hypothetical protein